MIEMLLKTYDRMEDVTIGDHVSDCRVFGECCKEKRFKVFGSELLVDGSETFLEGGKTLSRNGFIVTLLSIR